MHRDGFYKQLLDSLYDGVYFVDTDRRITYWNKGAERITGYRSDEVLGRQCSDNVLVHSDNMGSALCRTLCPLAATIKDCHERTTLVFLRHKDGHRVPITVRVTPIMDEDGSVAGGVEIFTDNAPALGALERVAELERLAYLDALTGLANRRFAEINLRARIEEFQRYGWVFGVLFSDIDRFKDVNDRHGHVLGDDVLRMVAKTLQNSVRPFDVVSRWGGEEFVVILANVQGRELQTAAERSRALVEQSILPVSGGNVTISVGATLALPQDTAETIVQRADALMYRSKQAGRNCVTTDRAAHEACP